MGSVPASGRVTVRVLIALGGRSRLAACGPIAITLTRRMRHLAVTSNRASVGENHKMMLDHYQQTKNLLVSYSQKPLGFSRCR